VTLSLAVVCEARSDFRMATVLADRVLCARVEWIRDGNPDDHRPWRGFTEAEPFLSWTRVPSLAKQHRVRAFGHFDNRPGTLEAALARQAILLLNDATPRPDAIVLVRDDDGKSQRRVGFEQARQATPIGLPVLIGLAHTKRECWVLAGFHTRTDGERDRLAALRADLGFDPCERAEGLTATDEGAKRSAKRVLGLLTEQDYDREDECLQADLDPFRRRGENTGLAAFLQEIDRFLVPLLTGYGGPG
jgi:hypothetical protein